MKKFYDPNYVTRDDGFPFNLHGATDGHILNMMDSKTHRVSRCIIYSFNLLLSNDEWVINNQLSLPFCGHSIPLCY